MMIKEKVVVGFSGGVDSAMCALILSEDYEVIPLFLDNGIGDGLKDAQKGAEALGLTLNVWDMKKELEEKVCKPFADAYLNGETPNPCILCNPNVKFRSICDFADSVGAKFIATGHYARVIDGKLYKALSSNDQSYMLCRLLKSQVERLILPLGSFEKPNLRKLAASHGLEVATKPDSMDICFIPDGDHAKWIENRGDAPSAGDVIFEGKVIAQHKGIHHYTVGQRRGLGFAAGRRVYVSEIRKDTNELVLSDADVLYVSEITAHSMNWLCDMPTEFDCDVKIRHSKISYRAKVTVLENDEIKITFYEPVRSPTRGQSAVLYLDDLVLGGAFIV